MSSDVAYMLSVSASMLSSAHTGRRTHVHLKQHAQTSPLNAILTNRYPTATLASLFETKGPRRSKGNEPHFAPRLRNLDTADSKSPFQKAKPNHIKLSNAHPAKRRHTSRAANDSATAPSRAR